MLSDLEIRYRTASNKCDVAKSSSFPPLQVLSITCWGANSWVSVIQNCATTLTSLKMSIGDVRPFGTVLRLAFPSLRHLSVSETSTASDIQLQLDDPILQSVYKGLVTRKTPRVILQLSKAQYVTDLTLCRVPFELAPYPRLRTLCIQGGFTEMEADILSLPDAINHCPELQSIRYRCLSWTYRILRPNDQFKLLINEALKGTQRAISLEEFTPEAHHLPGSPLRKVCIRVPLSKAH